MADTKTFDAFINSHKKFENKMHGQHIKLSKQNINTGLNYGEWKSCSAEKYEPQTKQNSSCQKCQKCPKEIGKEIIKVKPISSTNKL